MPTKDPSLLGSIIKMKCPNCRKGNMFCTPSIFPLKDLLKMPDHCTVCGQKMELEPGFYFGTGYVSYALSVALIAMCIVAYWIIFGMSYKDYSIFYALGSAIGVSVLFQPWLMRISRVIYLNFFVQYQKGTMMKSEE